MDRNHAALTGAAAGAVAGLTGVAAGLGAIALLRRRWRAVDLHGQVVLITGGSRGLGFLLAREFAQEGCRIAICARDAAELERAAHDLRVERAEVLAIPCDVSDQAQVQRLVAEVRARYGRIDILVNNAGAIQVGPVQSMEVEDFREAMQLMFWGVLYLTLAVLPEMLERKSGRIVNITSIGGKVSVPHLLPYTCAKFAAVGLSEGLRAELRSEGIRVVTIAPGLMRTGSFLHAWFKGNRKREFDWFSVGASAPLVTISAERAARQIVEATKRGQAERILTIPANVMAKFHGLFPGLTADLLSLANRFVLPRPQAGAGREKGKDVRDRAGSKVVDALRWSGLAAAGRYHQV